MATRSSSSTGKPDTRTREVDASDSARGADERPDAGTPPAADGVPAQEGAVADENTGKGKGPMADGSPAPEGA
jgi:hypothetical protein